MHEPNIFLVFLGPLNQMEIVYMVSGGAAAILYGEPRLTNDVDLVIDLLHKDYGRFQHAFPPDQFYCPPEEVLRVESSRSQRGHFNIIHHQTGLKADIYLKGRDPLHEWALRHTRTIEVDGESIRLAPVEYVIVRKLEFYREGGSQKHVDDIRGILSHSADLIEEKTLDALLRERGLKELWNEAAKE